MNSHQIFKNLSEKLLIKFHWPYTGVYYVKCSVFISIQIVLLLIICSNGVVSSTNTGMKSKPRTEVLIAEFKTTKIKVNILLM